MSTLPIGSIWSLESHLAKGLRNRLFLNSSVRLTPLTNRKIYKLMNSRLEDWWNYYRFAIGRGQGGMVNVCQMEDQPRPALGCNVCGKTFTVYEERHNHLLWHAENIEPPQHKLGRFSCSICKTTFRDYEKHHLHYMLGCQKKAEVRKTFHCLMCKDVFPDNTSRHEHYLHHVKTDVRNTGDIMDAGEVSTASVVGSITLEEY